MLPLLPGKHVFFTSKIDCLSFGMLIFGARPARPELSFSRLTTRLQTLARPCFVRRTFACASRLKFFFNLELLSCCLRFPLYDFRFLPPF